MTRTRFFRLNGHRLITSDIRDMVVGPHPVEHAQEKRVTKTDDRSFAAEEFELDVGTLEIKFYLEGTGENPREEADFIIGKVVDTPWTLEANSWKIAEPARLWKKHQRVALSTRNIEQASRDNNYRLILSITADVLGAWRDDTGSYTRLRRGWFEQEGTQLKNQDGEDVSNFEITIPKQDADHPKARNASTNKEEQLSSVSSSTEETRDGTSRPLETYDLSGYIHPSDPSSDGDTGQWELFASPHIDYINP